MNQNQLFLPQDLFTQSFVTVIRKQLVKDSTMLLLLSESKWAYLDYVCNSLRIYSFKISVLGFVCSLPCLFDYLRNLRVNGSLIFDSGKWESGSWNTVPRRRVNYPGPLVSQKPSLLLGSFFQQLQDTCITGHIKGTGLQLRKVSQNPLRSPLDSS